jgi:hypothetical protein
MIYLPLSLPSSWVPRCAPPRGRFLVVALLVVVPGCFACLVLQTRSDDEVPIPCLNVIPPPLGLLLMPLLPRLPTVTAKFPSRFSYRPAMVSCYGDAVVPPLRPSLSRLSSSTSPPSVRPQPVLRPRIRAATQAGSRGRCPLWLTPMCFLFYSPSPSAHQT